MSNNNSFQVLCGLPNPALAAEAPGLPPFDSGAVSFLADLSALLLADKAAKAYPDVVTFAFFCRRAHLLALRQGYESALPGRVGRGLVFHIAPGNVPVNFAYSLLSALLAGNAGIVKAPSQDFPQTRLLCAAMESLLEGEHKALRPYVNVIAYSRDRQDLTEAFSALCDARIIWGGDETVARVRQAALPPHAFDVTFADRYSLLLVQPQAVLAMDEAALAAMAQGFYNDTFLTDQNACTSPRLVYWVTEGCGADRVAEAKDRFWRAVHAYAAPRYALQPVLAVDKLTALYRAAVALPGAARVPMADNLIARIRVEALTPELLNLRCAGGCFVEYESPGLAPLSALCARRVQTLSYLGLEPEALGAFVLQSGLRGVDRIVPLGKTMDFSLTWDGYDLILALSRQLSIL